MACNNDALDPMKCTVTGRVLQDAETEMELGMQKVKGKEKKLDWAGGAIRL